MEPIKGVFAVGEVERYLLAHLSFCGFDLPWEVANQVALEGRTQIKMRDVFFTARELTGIQLEIDSAFSERL